MKCDNRESPNQYLDADEILTISVRIYARLNDAVGQEFKNEK